MSVLDEGQTLVGNQRPALVGGGTPPPGQRLEIRNMGPCRVFLGDTRVRPLTTESGVELRPGETYIHAGVDRADSLGVWALEELVAWPNSFGPAPLLPQASVQSRLEWIRTDAIGSGIGTQSLTRSGPIGPYTNKVIVPPNNQTPLVALLPVHGWAGLHFAADAFVGDLELDFFWYDYDPVSTALLQVGFRSVHLKGGAGHYADVIPHEGDYLTVIPQLFPLVAASLQITLRHTNRSVGPLLAETASDGVLVGTGAAGVAVGGSATVKLDIPPYDGPAILSAFTSTGAQWYFDLRARQAINQVDDGDYAFRLLTANGLATCNVPARINRLVIFNPAAAGNATVALVAGRSSHN